MAHSTRTLRIIAASVLALLMIGGAYALSGPLPFWHIVEAQSAEELLREYAAKDTDADGLPDWQEALYGTDPNNPESFQAGMLDGEAVAQGLIEPRVTVRPEGESLDPSSIPGTTAQPNSLTNRFAQTLLAQYLQNRGTHPPTNEEIVRFVQAGVANLTQESKAPARFATSDVAVSGISNTSALAAYAASAEAVFSRHTVPTDRSELAYFDEAMKGDSQAVAMITDISDAYATIADGLMALTVPAEARQAHLAIANALMRMSATSADMATLETDPLRALMGISLYDEYANELVSAFANLDGVLAARGVAIPEGQPGYYIVRTARDAAASQ